jgi:hypothetical protein
MIAVTVAAHNYLDKAIHLARTFLEHHPQARFILFQPEQTIHPSAHSANCFSRVLTPPDLKMDNLHRFIFRHSLLEFATAIKARLLELIFNWYPDEDYVIYLDPDIWVFGPFVELFEVLSHADIIVTPHHLIDEDTIGGIKDNVFRTLKCGIFNLGFLGLRRSVTTDAFIHWWRNKLEQLCYIDFARGLFLDQKWMDIAVCFFPLTILKEPGYNLANWNISKRPIVAHGNNWSVLGRPLRFIHFSGIDSGKDHRYFRKYAPSLKEPIHSLRKAYRESLAAIKSSFEHMPNGWSYDVYHSGQRINPEVRMACRAYLHLLDGCDDPFALSNEYFWERI